MQRFGKSNYAFLTLAFITTIVNVHAQSTQVEPVKVLSVDSGKFTVDIVDVRHFVKASTVPIVDSYKEYGSSPKVITRRFRALYGYVIETDKNEGTLNVTERTKSGTRQYKLPIDNSRCAWRGWRVTTEKPKEVKTIYLSIEGQAERKISWTFSR